MSSQQNGHRERLRAKFLASGFAALHDYEQIELLLTFAIVRKDAKPIAKELLSKFKTIHGILDAPFDDLKQVQGLGEHSATLIKVVKDTCSEYLSSSIQGEVIALTTPESVKDFARMKLGGDQNESFLVIFMNNQNCVIDSEVLFSGTVNKTIIYPRNVIQKALQKNATGLILVHNHPSGSLKPSKHDIELTSSMKSAAETLSIRLVDHLIVTQKETLSFVEKGLL